MDIKVDHNLALIKSKTTSSFFFNISSLRQVRKYLIKLHISLLFLGVLGAKFYYYYFSFCGSLI